jgi:hypothetical protein
MSAAALASAASMPSRLACIWLLALVSAEARCDSSSLASSTAAWMEAAPFCATALTSCRGVAAGEGQGQGGSGPGAAAAAAAAAAERR